MIELANLVSPTRVARPGMLVAEVLRACVDANVPGIPFQDASGVFTGKASIRHILKVNCIPDFMVQHAHLLGGDIGHLAIPAEHVAQVLELTIDPFVIPQMAVAESSTVLAKALALMEVADTTYLFVIDDGEYKGAVSIMAIGRALLERGCRHDR